MQKSISSKNKTSLIGHFDEWFKNDSIILRRKKVQEWWQNAYDDLYEQIKKFNNVKRVAYLGSGLGIDLDLAAFYPFNSKLFFIDICINTLIASKDILKSSKLSPHFICMDMELPCFKDSSFDVIIIINALMCTNKHEVIRLCSKMLKTNGKLILIEPLKYHPILYLYRKLEPRYRSIEVSCFNYKDIQKIRKDWKSIYEKEYYLISVMFFLFYKIFATKFLKKLMEYIIIIDDLILKHIIKIRKLAALGLYILEKNESVFH